MLNFTNQSRNEKQEQIYFLVKGAGEIGLGHIRRSMAIASAARKRGFQNISFVIEGPSEIRNLVSEQGFSLIDYSVLFLQKNGIVLIDRKDDVTSTIKELKKNGLLVALVDNSTKARLYADMVIYPVAHYRNELDWSGFEGTKLIGADFFPINEEFLNWGNAPNIERKNVLISMGGADHNNLTLRVLQALNGIESEFVDIVIGPVCQHKKELQAFQDTTKENIRFHYSPKNMSELMSCTALAISAFGITLYELAFMEVPAIIINNYREDAKDAEAFVGHGTAITLGYHETVTGDAILATVKKLATNKALSNDMSNRGHSLVDGKGSDRIVEAIENMIHGNNNEG